MIDRYFFTDGNTIHYEEVKNKLNEFLDSGESYVKKVQTSQTFFPPKNRKLMLQFHDGFDVMKPEKLLKWQHWTLDPICDQVPRIGFST